VGETMRTKLVAALVLTLTFVACREKATEAPAAKPAPDATSGTAPAEIVAIDGKTELLVPMKLPILLDDSALGIGSSDTEGVAEKKDLFAKTDRIRAALRTRKVPAGMVARVSWIDEEKKVLKEEQKPIPGELTWIVFDAPPLKWGTYAVEMYLGGNLMETIPFRVR